MQEARKQVQIEEQRLNAGIGVLSDGVVYTPRAINNVAALVEKQKENAFNFQESNLSLPTVDFISNLDFNARLIRQMNDMLLTPNVNTYDPKVKSQIEKYATVIADNYYILSNINVPKGELKSEVIMERVSEQKAQLEQIAGRLGIINPELSNNLKAKFEPSVFNNVIDVAKNATVADAGYKPTFKLNQ